MLSIKIIILALSLAFCQVEVLHFGSVKPFNCVKCMSGWYALAIGCWCIGWHGIIYLPLGVFVGAIFEACKMRYL